MSRSAIVVGAGVFGAGIAWHLAGSEWEVLLLDRDGPGNPRATSSSHSRVIRYGHGDEEWYSRLAWRARERWREIERESGERFLFETGVLWLARAEGGWEESCERTLGRLGIPAERLSVPEAARLYPSFRGDDLAWALLEPQAGVLRARRATEVLVELAERRGATFRLGAAEPHGAGVLVDGEVLHADRVVWALGPWLGRAFPEHVDLQVTRRDYVTFEVDPAWEIGRVPVFYDFDGPIYGLPDLDGQGLKVAPDEATSAFDPDTWSRELDRGKIDEARAYLAHRFPGLADAPQIGGRVCQYELTPDSQFIVAPHPEHPSVWLVGGGSGHGFKHAPALAEQVAALLSGDADPEERLGLGRRQPSPGLRSAAIDYA